MSFRSYRTPKGNLRVKRVHVSGAFIGGRSFAKPCCGSLNVDAFTPNDIVSMQERTKERRKARSEDQKKRAREYLNKEQEFQLWRGDTPFGKPKTMSGREARDLNRGFEAKFMDTTDPKARLWCWRMVGRKPMPTGTTVAGRRQYLFDRSVTA
jgi:hypothetical protein